MRNISAAGLAKLATRCGNEPVTILEVDWAPGRTRSYADRDVGAIPGRIVMLGDLDNVVGVSNNNSSQSLDITLDDTDGNIKALFDAYDAHKRDVRVYQWFDGLSLSDRFLLFAGKLSSPITWSEHERTVSFTVLSQLEDREVGFSAEEGQFPYLPADLVGKAWPLVFGTVQDCPALQLQECITGTTLTGVGVIAGQRAYTDSPLYSTGLDVDSGAAASLLQISAQLSTLWCAKTCAESVGDSVHVAEYLQQINSLETQRAQVANQAAAQMLCTKWQRARQLAKAKEKGLGPNPIQILGGEDFPQDTEITIDINGASFLGHFHGDAFYVYHRSCADLEDSDDDSDNATCPYTLKGTSKASAYDYQIQVPCTCAAGTTGTGGCVCRTRGVVVETLSSDTESNESDILRQFWADAGSTVSISSSEPITYVASIIPGTVLCVKAFRTYDGPRRLVLVPTNLYTVETKTYGSITAVQIIFDKALSKLKTTNSDGEAVSAGWEDDIYVTFQSTVGPNIADILVYLIDTYTDLTYDSGSFGSVRSKLAAFPANFPLLERKNTLTVLQEIAYQARCALWIDNGVFRIKYLPEEPGSDGEITVSDLDSDAGIQVELTSTEDLVTKMKVSWRVSWAPGTTDREKDKSEKRMILRHNVTKYGTQEEEYNWYIYNQPDIILKCATFWLIRKSQTWKRVKFRTFLQKLHLETFDTVTLTFADAYVAAGAVKAVVEKATYNSADNVIEFECLVPVLAGTMEKCKFFWPAALTVADTWPPPQDIVSGNAGGGGIGMTATGKLPVGYTDGIDSGGVVWVGGPNMVFRSRSDWGDSTPTDVDFTAQMVINSGSYGELQNQARPRLNLRNYRARPMDKTTLRTLLGQTSIDLSKTLIVDSAGDDPTLRSSLRSLLKGISADGRLMLRHDAMVADDARHQARFDFKYDDQTNVFGAGTAFLQD